MLPARPVPSVPPVKKSEVNAVRTRRWRLDMGTTAPLLSDLFDRHRRGNRAHMSSTRFMTAAEATALDKWYVIDANDQVLGRIATKAATILSGKHRPHFAPFLVTGDHVVIVNADKVRLTGQKLDQKVYRHHTRYPGGLREAGARKVFEARPERVVREAVLGMLPKNKLRKRMIQRLKIYGEGQHPHAAQRPEPLTL